jgi:hypothetical protein
MEKICGTCQAYGEQKKDIGGFTLVKYTCRKHAPPWTEVEFDDWCLDDWVEREPVNQPQ